MFVLAISNNPFTSTPAVCFAQNSRHSWSASRTGHIRPFAAFRGTGGERQERWFEKRPVYGSTNATARMKPAEPFSIL